MAHQEKIVPFRYVGGKMRYFKAAHTEATKSTDSFRVGATLVRGGEIISSGFNQGYKTHPLQAEMYPERDYKGVHAEVNAVSRLRPYDIGSGRLYVVRICLDGTYAISRPCGPCQDFLRGKGVKKVYFIHDSDNFGELTL